MAKKSAHGEVSFARVQYIRDNTTNNAYMTCVIRLNITTTYKVIF